MILRLTIIAFLTSSLGINDGSTDGLKVGKVVGNSVGCLCRNGNIIVRRSYVKIAVEGFNTKYMIRRDDNMM
jgi:hypothetical protein